MKDEIADLSLEDAQNSLSQLKPVTFKYKADENKDLKIGFVAEDVPDLVAEPGRKGVSPLDIVAVLTKVVQEQQERLETQDAEIAAQDEEIEGLKIQLARIELLEAKIEEIQKLVGYGHSLAALQPEGD